MKTIIRLTDFLAPKHKYRGGNWAEGSEDIPPLARNVCVGVIIALAVLYHVFRHAGS